MRDILLGRLSFPNPMQIPSFFSIHSFRKLLAFPTVFSRSLNTNPSNQPTKPPTIHIHSPLTRLSASHFPKLFFSAQTSSPIPQPISVSSTKCRPSTFTRAIHTNSQLTSLLFNFLLLSNPIFALSPPGICSIHSPPTSPPKFGRFYLFYKVFHFMHTFIHPFNSPHLACNNQQRKSFNNQFKYNFVYSILAFFALSISIIAKTINNNQHCLQVHPHFSSFFFFL